MLTDNVNINFWNMLLAGGMPVFFLSGLFIDSIFYFGEQVRPRSRSWGDGIISIAPIITFSALFNFVVKDFGEKHALIIVLFIIGAYLLPTKIDASKFRVKVGSAAASM